MQMENLQGWLVAETKEKVPDTRYWDRVIDLVQMDFRDRLLPYECTW